MPSIASTVRCAARGLSVSWRHSAGFFFAVLCRHVMEQRAYVGERGECHWTEND